MIFRPPEPSGGPTITADDSSAPPVPRGTSRILSACAGAAFLAFCLLVQKSSGAWSAGFVAFPDEPSHFVGAAMFRDWLVSGRWFAPLEFARSYYDHYPYFAVGYWPPLFSVVTGFWMLVTGVGRQQALFIPAVFAAGTGWLVFEFVKLRANVVTALCAGTLYLSLPVVREWVCAVMVDHVSAFFCFAAAACLLRYFKQPDLWNGSLCAIVSACAILSKYSAAYIVVLPFVAVVFLGRFELLRKPSLLMQPLIVGLMVGPWALWTWKLAFYGLPVGRHAWTAKRATSFALGALKIFPPVLMAVVVVGLIALLVRRRAWRDDFVVFGLLGAGHLAFLFLSPAGPEPRYLLVPAAVLLGISFAGWSEALALMSHARRWAPGISIFAAILTMVFVAWQFRDVAREPQDDTTSVVAVITKDPARVTQRIVVPPTLEGPVIAEFVMQRRNWQDYYLLRPGKILAHSNWLGLDYSSFFATPEEMMEYFRKQPVNLIIWKELPESTLRVHARIMSEMLRGYPLSWHKVVSLDSADGSGSAWTIYEYFVPSPASQ